MEYNYYDIGNRIRSEREKKRWTQDDLIERLAASGIHIGRNTLSSIENGNIEKTRGNYRLIPVLCKLFDCDAGYLLCEYDERYFNIKDICAYTHLPEETIYELHDDKPSALFFSYIASQRNLHSLVRDFHDFANICRTTGDMASLKQKPLREVTPSEAKYFVREYHLITGWQRIIDLLKDGGYKEYWRLIRTAYGAHQENE